MSDSQVVGTPQEPSAEHVLAVTRNIVSNCGYFQEFEPNVSKYKAIFNPSNQKFLSRPEAENDPTWKQLIPYVVFRRATQILTYVRSSNSGDERLQGKMSIGFGGHINPVDTKSSVKSYIVDPHGFLSAAYCAGIYRELEEELVVNPGLHCHTISTAGLINDDSNDVGKVHLGVVHTIALTFAHQVYPNEESIKHLKWLTISSIRAREKDLESWSRICVDHIF